LNNAVTGQSPVLPLSPFALASMKLSLSFFSVDTIVFTEYKSDYTFKGHYASDSETLSGEKVSSLDICKSEKLGL
jgi:hypothetical protein